EKPGALLRTCHTLHAFNASASLRAEWLLYHHSQRVVDVAAHMLANFHPWNHYYKVKYIPHAMVDEGVCSALLRLALLAGPAASPALMAAAGSAFLVSCENGFVPPLDIAAQIPAMNNPIVIQWYGITCDGCGVKFFRGERFKCCECPDYDLCSMCMS